MALPPVAEDQNVKEAFPKGAALLHLPHCSVVLWQLWRSVFRLHIGHHWSSPPTSEEDQTGSFPTHLHWFCLPCCSCTSSAYTPSWPTSSLSWQSCPKQQSLCFFSRIPPNHPNRHLVISSPFPPQYIMGPSLAMAISNAADPPVLNAFTNWPDFLKMMILLIKATPSEHKWMSKSFKSMLVGRGSLSANCDFDVTWSLPIGRGNSRQLPRQQRSP